MRPFTFINVAASADGKISDQKKRQIKISCEEDAERVDRLRASSDAIMVGIGTVLSDNPRLTVKNESLRSQRVADGKPSNPIRVVVDSRCRVPQTSHVLNDDARTILAVSEKAEKTRVEEISEMAEVIITGKERVNLSALSTRLFEIGIGKLMVEGGGTLNHSMLSEGLVDEIIVYYGNMIIGSGPSPVEGNSFDPPLRLELSEMEKIGNGVFVRWRCV
ncbi:MAG: 2,5-diamino-6-(ribosylamino)-4(3H)-pyrimidinone 5'-phosphate reductase [Archaeoglobaceae archaeon]